jgi:hypothetical protein
MIRLGADASAPLLRFGTAMRGRNSGTQDSKPEGAGVRGGVGNCLIVMAGAIVHALTIIAPE